MTALADYEKTCWEALARHGRAISDGTPARLADPELIDALLRAYSRGVMTAITTAIDQRERADHARRELAARPLIQAVRSVTHG